MIVPKFSTQAWARLPEVKVGIVFLFDYWTPAEWSIESRQCISSHFLSKMILKGYAEYCAMCFSLQPLVVYDDEMFSSFFGDRSHQSCLIVTPIFDSYSVSRLFLECSLWSFAESSHVNFQHLLLNIFRKRLLLIVNANLKWNRADRVKIRHSEQFIACIM